MDVIKGVPVHRYDDKLLWFCPYEAAPCQNIEWTYHDIRVAHIAFSWRCRSNTKCLVGLHRRLDIMKPANNNPILYLPSGRAMNSCRHRYKPQQFLFLVSLLSVWHDRQSLPWSSSGLEVSADVSWPCEANGWFIPICDKYLVEMRFACSGRWDVFSPRTICQRALLKPKQDWLVLSEANHRRDFGVQVRDPWIRILLLIAPVRKRLFLEWTPWVVDTERGRAWKVFLAEKRLSACGTWREAVERLDGIIVCNNCASQMRCTLADTMGGI